MRIICPVTVADRIPSRIVTDLDPAVVERFCGALHLVHVERVAGADAATVGAPGRPVKGQGASVGNEPGGCGGERIETVSRFMAVAAHRVDTGVAPQHQCDRVAAEEIDIERPADRDPPLRHVDPHGQVVAGHARGILRPECRGGEQAG